VKTYDITPKIRPSLAVFPGDQGFSRTVSLAFERGDPLALSSMTTTLHLGAHTDAPNHYHAEGQDIASSPLDHYMGRAQVIEIKKGKGERILVQDLKAKSIAAPRVLFKTGSFPNPERWNDDFNALSHELIDYLAAQGVRLVGIDTPSVDPAQDKTLESHQAIYRKNLRILEGITLSQVQEGLYTLIALPLPIEGGDASPVRAILIDKDLGIP
jgi:arylformamidase